MKVPFYTLEREYRRLKPGIDSALRRVVKRQFFILGDELAAFEAGFARAAGTRFCCGVASGTDGLILALKSLGIGRGDEVIVPALSFVATALAVTEVGARPVFTDIDAETYCIDAALIPKAVTKKTRAILPVHLYGLPCDMKPIVSIARGRGIAVIEDACQAHGATLGGKTCGSFGKVSVFSFYPSKNLGACGDGGAVCTSSRLVDARLRLLRNYGQRIKYHHDEPGVNSRLDEIQAAVLSEKLAVLERTNRERAKMSALYSGLLKGFKQQKVPAGSFSCRHLFVIEHERRDGLIAYLAEKGIGTAIHYPVPLHLQGCFRGLGYRAGAFPVAERVCSKILSLPLFPGIREDEIEYVAKAVCQFRG